MKKCLIAVFYIILYSSCVQKTTYHPLPQEYVDATTFKAGSFFVYKDSVTGSKDSFYTIIGSKMTNTGMPPNNEEYQNSHCYFICSDNSKYFNIYASLYAEAVSLDFTGLTASKISGTVYALSSVYIRELLPTFYLNGHTYNNVQVFKSLQLNSDTIISYFNKEVGLIKLQHKSDVVTSSIELTNYSSLK